MKNQAALGAVYGVLLNFKNELSTLGDAVNRPPYKAPPRAPVLYIKPANTWVGHNETIPMPAGESAVQIGATLGIVFNRPVIRVDETNALDHVAGYCVVNDVRLPHDNYFRPAIKQLCRDGFCSMSEVFARDRIEKIDRLALRAYVNGTLEQESNTADLVRSASRLIADITDFMTLGPGDVLLVGVAQGRPSARAGDRVAVEVEGLSRLENIVGAAA